MCQVLVLSVFNGFEDLVQSLYSNFYSDVRVVAAKGKTILLTSSQISALQKFPGVKSISLIAEDKAMLQNGELQTVVFLKGVDANYANVSGVPANMLNGTFNTGNTEEPLLVLGSGIENAIGVEADKSVLPLNVFLPKKHLSNSGDILSSLSEGNAYPSGSFAIQQDFDNKYVLTNIDFVKQQMEFAPDEYSALEISLNNPKETEQITSTLQNKLGKQYKVQTKYQQNSSLYNSMKLEKWAIYAVLTLILILAAFNMISALTMLVLEKKKDISVLQSLGAHQTLIKKIFLSEGLLLALIGAATGVCFALIICLLQVKYHLIKLEGNSFLIDYFPVKVLLPDILLVAATSLVIAFIAAWFPAQKASKQTFELKI